MKRYQMMMIVWCILLIFFTGSCDVADRHSPNEPTDPAMELVTTDITNIVGGHEAPPGTWPFIAAIVYRPIPSPATGQFCGGTLIAPRWVLTAAHCVFGNPYPLDVILGTTSLDAAPSQYERIEVSQKIPHPYYNNRTTENDIALLQLVTSSTMRIARWDSSGMAQPGRFGVVAGWGAIDIFGNNPSMQLLQVMLPILPNEKCAEKADITDTMFCAAYPVGGKDSCYGDSGGPFMVNGILTGIISWGSHDYCAMPEEYGMYTRISSYADWIVSTITRY